MTPKKYLLLIMIPFCACQAPSGQPKIVYTHVVYRHGDRSPGGTFPKDTYQEEYWPQGWSQLTNKGMQQQYDLGKYFSERYIKTFGLLSVTYKRDEIYVRSTDKDRTLQSAQCNLAGLYPADGNQVWNPDVLKIWQPIPIHTVPIEDDILLDMDADCPNYQKLYDELNNERIKKYNEDYKDFFKYVGEKTGWPDLDVKTIKDVYSPLYREREQNLPLPDWVDEIYDKKNNLSVFDIIVQLKTVDKNMAYDTDLKAKYCAGYLIGEIIERMKEISKNVKKSKLQKSTKMLMYSAHDDTVLGLMYVMKVVKEGLIIPYVGCVMIELYKNENGQFTVQVYYRNSTNDDPIQLTQAICKSSYCTIDEFANVLSSQILYPAGKRNEFCGVISKCDQSDDKNQGVKSSIVGSNMRTTLTISNLIFVLIYFLH